MASDQKARNPVIESRPGPYGDRFTRFGAGLVHGATVLLVAAAVVCGIFGIWWATGLLIGLWLFILNFFRNPVRTVPEAANDSAGLVISAADGKVIDVMRVESEEYIDGPATRIAIFLSVFNVHVNRAPVTGVVRYLNYKKGTFRSATDAAARETNECQAIGQEMADGTRVLTRQIAGLIARRIVCPLEEGDALEQGFDFGMIRFGSQTEISIPDREGLRFEAKVSGGDKVAGGETVLGEWVAIEKDVDEPRAARSSAG